MRNVKKATINGKKFTVGASVKMLGKDWIVDYIKEYTNHFVIALWNVQADRIQFVRSDEFKTVGW